MNVTLYFIFFAIIIILLIAAWAMESTIPMYCAFMLLLVCGITMASTGVERANVQVNKTTESGVDILTETTIYTDESSSLTTWSGIMICFVSVILFLIVTAYRKDGEDMEFYD